MTLICLGFCVGVKWEPLFLSSIWLTFFTVESAKLSSILSHEALSSIINLHTGLYMFLDSLVHPTILSNIYNMFLFLKKSLNFHLWNFLALLQIWPFFFIIYFIKWFYKFFCYANTPSHFSYVQCPVWELWSPLFILWYHPPWKLCSVRA